MIMFLNQMITPDNPINFQDNNCNTWKEIWSRGWEVYVAIEGELWFTLQIISCPILPWLNVINIQKKPQGVKCFEWQSRGT